MGKKTLAATLKPFHVNLALKDDDKGEPEGVVEETRLVPLESVERQGEQIYVDRIERKPFELHFEQAFLTPFNVFKEMWIPFPIFAIQSQNPDLSPIFYCGPSDWARAWLTPPTSQDSLVWKLTVVFDPQIENPRANPNDENLPTYFPTLRAKEAEGSTFSLAWHEKDNSWFVDKRSWVKKFLKQHVKAYLARHPKERLSLFDPDEVPAHALDYQRDSFGNVDEQAPPVIRTEYMALYETLLEAIHLSGAMPDPIRVPNIAHQNPVDVSLVIDVGNSRITGVLVETVPQRETKLTDCYPLRIRDLTSPSHVYAEPFDTSLEFVEPFFGPPEWSFASDSRGHRNSFKWPSTVRVGREAARLAANSKEEMGPTGMSSPKRYLWDTRPQILGWYFNNVFNYHNSLHELPAVAHGSFVLNINSAGIPLSYFNRRDRQDIRRLKLPPEIGEHLSSEDSSMVAFNANYSRSSLMMFLLAELVAQALSCVNSPMVRDARENSNLPRRLRKIILTVPTAMPLAEQNIFKTWARLAVESVWVSLGWWRDFFEKKDGPMDKKDGDKSENTAFQLSPEVRCEWYESTCTQLVWLYNELHKKFHNNATELFTLLGKKRSLSFLPGQGAASRESDSLRIASIDVGGGTTDISIITYSILNPGAATPHILPYQDFRDGFNVAGDDIMREVIRSEFVKSLEKAALDKGVYDAENIFTGLFTDTVAMGVQDNVRAQKLLRSQFVSHVATPVALHILRLYEETDFIGGAVEREVRLRDILQPEGEKALGWLANILSYVEEPLRQNGWKDFQLLDFSFKVDMRMVDRSVGFVINQILVDMGEIVSQYDCDLLILTGRPSRWPAIMRVPYERNFLPVDRVVHMHKYRVNSEYPFVNHNRIEDPKTSVVVGAIILSLAEGSLSGITVDAENFTPQPINRYLGMLYDNGKLDNNDQNVWFTNTEVQEGREILQSRTISFNANTAVGFRQLSCDRWTTTRLYSLEFRDSAAVEKAKGNLPYQVELAFEMKQSTDLEDDTRSAASKAKSLLQRTEGTLKVSSVTDRRGGQVNKSDVTVRLQTLRSDSGYWLDTGALIQV
jgi:hypothetical protein